MLFILINCGTDDLIEQIIDVDRDFEIQKLTNLTFELNETSGLINFDGTLITHIDGGGIPTLYEIDKDQGEIIRKVEIENIIAVDIEDISQDEHYIYLADIGNNSNSRKDLVIYKIAKSDYLVDNKVSAELIEISYKEQTDFSKSNNATNFDAEAIVSIGDHLFLFTKNWLDYKTSVYKVSKNKGAYVLEALSNYDVGGLVTGADYHKGNNTVILTGYLGFAPFIIKLDDFSENNPLDGKKIKKFINVTGSVQIEGVAANPNGSFYLSSERNSGLSACLYELNLN